jgi:uncharacterized protein (DUF302 family)
MTWAIQHTTTLGPFTLTVWQDGGRFVWSVLRDDEEAITGSALSLSAAQHDAEHTARERLS